MKLAWCQHFSRSFHYSVGFYSMWAARIYLICAALFAIHTPPEYRRLPLNRSHSVISEISTSLSQFVISISGFIEFIMKWCVEHPHTNQRKKKQKIIIKSSLWFVCMFSIWHTVVSVNGKSFGNILLSTKTTITGKLWANESAAWFFFFLSHSSYTGSILCKCLATFSATLARPTSTMCEMKSLNSLSTATAQLMVSAIGFSVQFSPLSCS